MNKKIFTLFTAISLFCNISSNAQWTSNLNLNTSCITQSGGESQMSASTKDGKTYISYYKLDPGGLYHMYLQLLDANGNKMWGSDGVVVTSYNSNSYTTIYDLKVDSLNNAIIAFRVNFTNDYTMVAKYDQMGNPLWGANGVILNGSTGGGIILVTPLNNIIIGDNTSGYIYKLSPAGTMLWTAPDTTEGWSIRGLINAKNEDYIATYIKGTYWGGGRLNAMKYDGSGAKKWANPVQVSNIAYTYHGKDFFVSDGNNGFYSAIPGGTTIADGFAQHITDTGGVAWGAVGTEVITEPTNNINVAGLAYNATQNSIYVLVDYQDNAQSNLGSKIQKINSAGVVQFTTLGKLLHPLGTSLNGSTVTGLNYQLLNENDGMVYTYTDSTTHLFADKVDTNGNFVWQKTLSTVASNKSDCRVNFSNYKTHSDTSQGFNNYQTVAVWSDDRNPGSVIYAQNILTTKNIPFPLAINSVVKPNSVNLYPNPSNGENLNLEISSNYTEPLTISVFDATGKIVYTTTEHMNSGDNNFKLNIQNVTTGIYFIKCNSTNYQFNYRWNCIK